MGGEVESNGYVNETEYRVDGMDGNTMEGEAPENTSQTLLEQNQRLIFDNRNLVEENTKLVSDILYWQEEFQQVKMANAKLMLQLDKYDLKAAMSDGMIQRGHSKQSITPCRPTVVDSERGLAGSLGRWSSKHLEGPVPDDMVKSSKKGPVRGLVLRVGHLMHPVPELEAYADFLDKQGFQTRDSLAILTDKMADELGLPYKLASALRCEVMSNRLKQRYTGPVQPIPEIENDPGKVNQLAPHEVGPYAQHHQNSKEPNSIVTRQVLRVGHRLHAPWELQKFAKILEENAFVTRESLGLVTDDVAMRLRVPLKLAAALRDQEKPAEKSSGGQRSPRSARSPETKCSLGAPRAAFKTISLGQNASGQASPQLSVVSQTSSRLSNGYPQPGRGGVVQPSSPNQTQRHSPRQATRQHA